MDGTLEVWGLSLYQLALILSSQSGNLTRYQPTSGAKIISVRNDAAMLTRGESICIGKYLLETIPTSDESRPQASRGIHT